MNNDKKARLLNMLLSSLDDMEKDVGEYNEKLQPLIDELVDTLDSTAHSLRVDTGELVYLLLQKFSGVDSFNQAPTDHERDAENYEMLRIVFETCIVLVEDLKNEIEKVEK